MGAGLGGHYRGEAAGQDRGPIGDLSVAGIWSLSVLFGVFVCVFVGFVFWFCFRSGTVVDE